MELVYQITFCFICDLCLDSFVNEHIFSSDMEISQGWLAKRVTQIGLTKTNTNFPHLNIPSVKNLVVNVIFMWPVGRL